MIVPRIQLEVIQIADLGGSSPRLVVRNNPRRVFLTINPTLVVGGAFLCVNPNGGIDSVFDQLIVGPSLTYLRYDLGVLVTGEIYATDGNHKSPHVTITVTEGILL